MHAARQEKLDKPTYLKIFLRRVMDDRKMDFRWSRSGKSQQTKSPAQPC